MDNDGRPRALGERAPTQLRHDLGTELGRPSTLHSRQITASQRLRFAERPALLSLTPADLGAPLRLVFRHMSCHLQTAHRSHPKAECRTCSACSLIPCETTSNQAPSCGKAQARESTTADRQRMGRQKRTAHLGTNRYGDNWQNRTSHQHSEIDLARWQHNRPAPQTRHNATEKLSAEPRHANRHDAAGIIPPRNWLGWTGLGWLVWFGLAGCLAAYERHFATTTGVRQVRRARLMATRLSVNERLPQGQVTAGVSKKDTHVLPAVQTDTGRQATACDFGPG